MTKYIKDNKIILLIIVIAVIAAVCVIIQRSALERSDKSYDIVVDYDELKKLATQSEHNMDWWLSEYKKMGIQKIGVSEESIMSLMENTDLDISGKVMDNLTRDASWREDYPEKFLEQVGDFSPFDVMVVAEGKEAVDFLNHGISRRIDKEKYVAMTEGEKAYFLIRGTSDVTLYSQVYKYMNSQKGGFIERSDIVSSKIMYISLGLLPSKVEQVQRAGLEVIPRTMSYNGWNGKDYAEAVVEGYSDFGIVPKYIIVGGEAVFGFDDGSEFAKNYIMDNDITIGLIENTTQRQNIIQNGVPEVAETSGYNTVRVFTVWNYIQYRYQYYGYPGAEEIENTLFRAVTERNIRVIYFKPFLKNKDLYTYITDVEDYRNMFANLEDRLARHGFTYGEASTIGEYRVNRILQMLIAIGAVCGAVLLLCCVLPIGRKASYVLTALGILGVLAAFYVMPNTSVLLTAFGAAVVFACLAATFLVAQSKALGRSNSVVADAGAATKPQQPAPWERSNSAIADAGVAADAGAIADAELSFGRILLYSILTLVVCVLISLVGGIMTAAPISSTSYMLEIDLFRGVKLSQLLPLAYFIVAYMAYYGFKSGKKHMGRLELHDIKAFLDIDIKVWMILALGVVGALGYYYIARTGHDTSVEVSGVEMLFRNKLEEVLLARPRTKEFLFAFPAIMMTAYCGAKRYRVWALIFGGAGVIGMTSVINTFMHIRTPLYLGFVRTGYSMLFGMILGAVAMVIFDRLCKVYSKYLKEKVDRALQE